jgi:hypothetical protein
VAHAQRVVEVLEANRLPTVGTPCDIRTATVFKNRANGTECYCDTDADPDVWACRVLGTSSPAGSDEQVQLNESSAFGGANQLTYDYNNDITKATTLETKIENEIRHLYKYATGGAGTTGDPWTGWESAFAANTIHIVKEGYYEAQGSGEISIPDAAVIACEDGATFRWPTLSSKTYQADMFVVPSTSSDVAFFGCKWRLTNPDEIALAGDGHANGGGAWIEVGTVNSETPQTVTIQNNDFGFCPMNTGKGCSHIFVRGSQLNSSFSNNKMGTAWEGIYFDPGDNTNQILYENVKIHGNQFHYIHGNTSGLCDVAATSCNEDDDCPPTETCENALEERWLSSIALGDSDTTTYPAIFKSTSVVGNTVTGHGSGFVWYGGQFIGLTIADNTVTTWRSTDILVKPWGVPDTGDTLRSQDITITGNNCSFTDGAGAPSYVTWTTDNGQACDIGVTEADGVTVSDNAVNLNVVSHDGIILLDVTDFLVHDNRIQQLATGYTARGGIRIGSGSSDGTISDNVIIDFAGWGINVGDVSAVSDIVIKDNFIVSESEDLTTAGIYIENSSTGIYAIGNTIKDSGGTSPMFDGTPAIDLFNLGGVRGTSIARFATPDTIGLGDDGSDNPMIQFQAHPDQSLAYVNAIRLPRVEMWNNRQVLTWKHSEGDFRWEEPGIYEDAFDEIFPGYCSTTTTTACDEDDDCPGVETCLIDTCTTCATETDPFYVTDTWPDHYADFAVGAGNTGDWEFEFASSTEAGLLQVWWTIYEKTGIPAGCLNSIGKIQYNTGGGWTDMDTVTCADEACTAAGTGFRYTTYTVASMDLANLDVRAQINNSSGAKACSVSIRTIALNQADFRAKQPSRDFVVNPLFANDVIMNSAADVLGYSDDETTQQYRVDAGDGRFYSRVSSTLYQSSIPLLEATTAPTNPSEFAIWRDTDDPNAVYLNIEDNGGTWTWVHLLTAP